MKIGDRVFVRGYIDEIRKDTVIIRNAGGYFGTIPNEVITGELPSAQPTIEPKKGKWIEDAETFYKAVNERGGGVDADTPYFTEDDIACSECLALFSVIDNCTECFDFCPNCGARMEE